MFVILFYTCYVFYQIWDDEQKTKKSARKRLRGGPPMSKAEYDCTENFYHD